MALCMILAKYSVNITCLWKGYCNVWITCCCQQCWYLQQDSEIQCKTTVVGLMMQKLSTMATVLFNSWCPVTAFAWLIIVVCMWLCIMWGYFVLVDSLPCWLVVPRCWWFPFLISSCVGVYSNFLNCYSQCVLCIMLSRIYYNNRIYIKLQIFLCDNRTL